MTGLARFSGPGRTVEHTMQKNEAHAIAQALGIPFEAIDVAPAQKSLQNYDS